jgi:hypothetical protein
MCLEAVFFWPVFLCLFWAMFLCPVRACFLACAPSGFFWAFFCASFFEGNKSSRGVSPPPPLGALLRREGAWAHGRNMAGRGLPGRGQGAIGNNNARPQPGRKGGPKRIFLFEIALPTASENPGGLNGVEMDSI